MPTLPKEELLSAYFDGELSAGEQAQVEQWLADEPELRQLHDDLRSLRGTLQNLPCFKLPDGFASRVQRAAEERMLTHRTAGVMNQAAMPATNGRAHYAPQLAEAPVPAKPAWRDRIRRPIAWSTVVLAAAVLLMFLNPEQTPNGTATGTGDSSNQLTASDSGGKSRKGAGENAISARVNDKQGQTSDSTAGKTPDSQVPAGLAGVSIRVTPDGFAADGLLVVNCDVTLKALREGAFRNLLKQAQIGWETDDATPTPPADETVGKETQRPQEVQVVYVEANAGQIERVLHSLNSQAAAFPNVALVPIPGADWQYAWQARYDRQGHPTQTADSEGEAPPGSSQPIRKSGPIKGPPLKSPPIKGPAIDANPSNASSSTEPVGRAWSIEVPTARPPADVAEPKPAAKDKNQDTPSVDQASESAMLRVLFVLRVVGS